MNDLSFDRRLVSLKDLQLEAMVPSEVDPVVRAALLETNGLLPVHGGKMVTRVLIDGEPFYPTGRFWESLYSRFQLNNAFFRFFSHIEVFNRISEREQNDRIRITIERNTKTGDNRLLAATGLNKPVMVYDDLMDIVKSFRADEGGIRYHNGVVTSTHTPRIGQSPFKIAGDQFSNRYELHCPVDGYGAPSVYLALLRWVCSNGAVGFSNTFRTSLNLGGGSDNPQYVIRRALDSFTNDEGYSVLRHRFENATRSWASIREHQSLYKLMLTLQTDPVLMETIGDWKRVHQRDLSVSHGNALMQAFDRTLGDPVKQYHLDPNMMSAKKARSLPVPCKVYDMFNFATELASHHVSEAGARQLQAWIGDMLGGSSEYDLEESCDQFSNWREIYLANLPTMNKTLTTGK